VLVNRNVPNGVEPILQVIGGLPPGTPAASGAAFGTGWLVELLQGYGFEPHLVHPLRCKAIASARLKNDKGRRRDLGAAAARGPAPGSLDRAARGAPVAGAAAAPGPAGAAADAAAQTGSTPCWPATAMTAQPGTAAGRAGNGWPRCRCPPSPAKRPGTAWR
jgi:hypothetical protein